MWIYLNKLLCLKKSCISVHHYQNFINKNTWQDFPDGPVVEILPPNAGVVGSIPDQGAKFPHASQSKKTPKNKSIK